MTRYKTWLLRASLILSVCFIGAYAWRYYRIYFPVRNHLMIPLLQNMQTYCVGRYQIDLPRGSRLIRTEDSAGRGAGTNFYFEHPIGKFEAHAMAQGRWLELKDLKPGPYEEFTQPSQRIDLSNGGVVFTFKHEDVFLEKWPDGTRGMHSFYENEGYLWADDALYRFVGASEKEETIAAMNRLVPLDNVVMPATQGFCAGRSFFPGAPVVGESVNFAFRLPESTNAEIRIRIPMSNPVRPNYTLLNLGGLKTTKLRSARRMIGALDGEEWGNMMVDPEGGEPDIARIGFDWFHPEGESDHLKPKPSIHIFMEGSVPTGGKAVVSTGRLGDSKDDGVQSLSTLLSKEEFIVLWDGIMETFRERPGAF